MSRSNKFLALASLAGAPFWMMPNAHVAMGNVLFFGGAIVCIAAGLIGIAFWAFDRK